MTYIYIQYVPTSRSSFHNFHALTFTGLPNKWPMLRYTPLICEPSGMRSAISICPSPGAAVSLVRWATMTTSPSRRDNMPGSFLNREKLVLPKKKVEIQLKCIQTPESCELPKSKDGILHDQNSQSPSKQTQKSGSWRFFRKKPGPGFLLQTRVYSYHRIMEKNICFDNEISHDGCLLHFSWGASWL